MTERDYRLLLRQTLDGLEKTAVWLRRSQALCAPIDVRGEPDEEECDALEALASRYARASDMLVQRAFRGIDRVELEDPGSVPTGAQDEEGEAGSGGAAESGGSEAC